MTFKYYILIGAAALMFFLGLDAFYIVNEQNQAIVTQFGRPIGEPVTTPGLKFKVPFIQRVNYFDKRYLEWDGDVNQIPTRDKRFLFVDTYARWEITDPLQFFRRLRDERGGQSRLDDILDGETRNAVANNELLELIRSTNRSPEETEDFFEDMEVLELIEVGRDAIEANVLQAANERTSDLGIRVLDFRFKRINYVDDVRGRVYERMISERNRIADLFRSEGQGEARRISGEKEREMDRIMSEAVRTSDRIRGRADAEATATYATAYNQNATSRDLYAFLKTLETYENTLDESVTLILSTDSDLYRLMRRSE